MTFQVGLAAVCALVVGAPVISSAQRSQPASAPTTAPSLSIIVRHFRFTGNTRFSSARLEHEIAKYENRPISQEDLEQARQQLTLLYVNNGFINSGAVLPDQESRDRIITFKIIEGKLSEVRLKFGNLKIQLPSGRVLEFKGHLLRDGYVRGRIEAGAQPPPLNIVTLKNQLELLREDPVIESINAELHPGAAQGESYLDATVQESNPFGLALVFSNRRPPSVGSTAFDLQFSDRDLTGHGDPLAIRYDIANGPLNDFRPAGADDYSIDYAIPLSPHDTTLSFDFTRTDAIVVQAPFTHLDITSLTDSYSFTLRRPFYRRPVSDEGRPSVDFSMFLTAAWRDSRENLLGEPFSFSPGTVNGTSQVAALRFGQEYLRRSQTAAFSARSTFSFGINAMGSTPDRGELPGGRFISWLGQFQYVREIPGTDLQVLFKAAGQLADRSLLPIEQFAIGGIDTDRGYPEEEVLRDEGVVGTAEFHVPILRGKSAGPDVLQFIPFVDLGYGANRTHMTGISKFEYLPSAGIGLVFTPNRFINAQIFYGVPFRDVEKSHHDVEDQGLHFSVTISAF